MNQFYCMTILAFFKIIFKKNDSKNKEHCIAFTKNTFEGNIGHGY